MKANTASRTAQYMALFRALESSLPKPKRLFTDSHAINFLDNGLKTATKVSSFPLIGSIIPKIVQSRSAGAFSSGVARTKYIDDLLEQTIANGIRQVIILGAGFDTRALRLPFLKEVSVIEIDHPDTSNFKLKKLKETSGELPTNVNYLQLDFNKQSLEDFAREQNLNFGIPTTIIWEGVSNYLPKEAIDNTFRFVKKFAAGSSVIFTYIHRDALDKPNSFRGIEKVRVYLTESEEQWKFGFIPNELPQYLQQFGLRLQEDTGAADYRKKYMPQRTGYLQGYEFYRVALAKRT